MFDLQQIQAATFVAETLCRETVPSTNDWALEIARGGQQQLPLLVLAWQQTQGRGRGGNRWWTAPGALTFSLLLDPRRVLPPAGRLPPLSLVCGLGVCTALASLLPDRPIQLKWPNDVLLDGGKVCGILIESPAQPPNRCVVGIGINVNNSFAEAPAEVRRRAISLADATGTSWDLTAVLIAVLQHLERCLNDFAASRLPLEAACRPWCALRGKTLTIVAGNQRVTGLCRGIDDQGALRIETPQGLRPVVSGVVEA